MFRACKPNMFYHIVIIALITFIYGSSPIESATIDTKSNTMPTFEDSTCPENYPDNYFCIGVNFPNSAKDMLILTKLSGTSIFEGFLREDDEVPVVMIDTPATRKRMINFNSDNVPNCSYFDVDLTTNHVRCLRARFNDNDITGSGSRHTSSAECPDVNEHDPIVPLGQHYPKEILVKVLFTFDSAFHNYFDGQDGKSSEEHMDEVIKIVQNAYKHKTFKNEIGTQVNVLAEKRILDWEDPSWGHFLVYTEEKIKRFHELNEKGGDFDVHVYVTYVGGYAWGGIASEVGDVCDKDSIRVNMNIAYGPDACSELFESNSDCTATDRLSLTAQVIAHEMGHNLGMRHDFSDCLSDIENKKYVYRKYNGKECRGLMDYAKDGIGWSQCSMMDFSRYITSEGTQKPCLEGAQIQNPGQTSESPQTREPETTIGICNGHRCGSGECITYSWVCDQQKDCEDNSDEQDCSSTQQTIGPESTTDPCNGHQCGSGECIHYSWVCDEQQDCEDNSDEEGC